MIPPISPPMVREKRRGSRALELPGWTGHIDLLKISALDDAKAAAVAERRELAVMIGAMRG